MGAPSDMFYLYSARAARGFGDGFAALILPAYLSALGFGPVQIGIVAAAALLGSAVLTLAIGLIAPRYDLRTLLLACAGLMIATGIAFPASQHFVFIALVAFIGTINPTTGDIGVHVPLEQAAVARSVPDRERTRTFARYSLIGALSIAAGALTAAAPDALASLGMEKIIALKLMFYVYAALGLLAAVLYAFLPHATIKQTSSPP
jgi:MFS family permease